MYLNPVVAVTLGGVLWLTLRGHPTLRSPSQSGRWEFFFIFMALFVAIGFFPEAWHAKQLISDTVLHTRMDESSDIGSPH